MLRKMFNINGDCKPLLHYMVNIEDRLNEVKKMVEQGSYFTINRARQFGKTTMLRGLAEFLENDYMVISLDFQMLGAAKFRNENIFSIAFANIFIEAAEGIDDTGVLGCALSSFREAVEEHKSEIELFELFGYLSEVCRCSEKPVVLLVDEVDSASNNQVFLDFLAQLRGYYLDRERRSIFHSVILAAVYDIKNLKQKIRPDEAHQYNSPWNIAAEFKLHMSFSAKQIAAMLEEYESEHHTGMQVAQVAEEIYQYTSGYPYLVSVICKYLDEEVPELEGFENPADVWTAGGIAEAVKILLNANVPLFGSMMRHISEYPDLKKMLYVMLFQGERVAYNPDHRTIELARMFGYVVNDHGIVRVANRIFETRLYNLFLSEEELESAMSKMAKRDQNQFIAEGKLDMVKVLEKFVEYFHDIYGENDEKFMEAYGRKFFLLYLKPIINGTGNYYIEAQTRDAKRTDLVVDYLGEQYVIELKIAQLQL